MCTFYNIDVSDMTIRQINRLFGLSADGSTLQKGLSGVYGVQDAPTQTALNMPMPLMLK